MNDILNSFVQGIGRQDALKQQAIQNKLAQQTQDQANDYHQGLLSDAMDTLDETRRQHDAANSIAQQLHSAQMDKMRADLAHSVETGNTVPGSKILSTKTDPLTGYRLNSVQLPESANMPNGQPTVVDLMHPEDYAASQAKIQNIRDQPAIDKASAIDAAKQKDLADRLTEQENLKSTHAQQLKQMELDSASTISQAVRSSQEKIARGNNAATTQSAGIHAAGQIQAAKIREGADQMQSLMTPDSNGNTTLGQITDKLSSGQLNAKDLKDMFPNAPLAVGAILQSAAKNGVAPFTAQQQTKIPAWQSLASLLPLVKQTVNTQSDRSSFGPLGAVQGKIQQMTDPAWKNLESQLDAKLPLIATALGGEAGQRLSNVKIAKASGLLPDPSLPKVENQKRVVNLINEIKTQFDATYQNLSPGQRQHLSMTTGLGVATGDILPKYKNPLEGLDNQ